MGNKRISRKQLKDRIKELKRLLESERTAYKLDVDRMNDRLRSIGIHDVEPIAGDLPCVPVEVPLEPWGKWAYVQDDERIIEEFKTMLVHDLATALIDNNIVQFIVKTGAERERNTPFDFPTVGVKLYCIPWEKVNNWGNGKIAINSLK